MLAIEADGASYHSADTARDRDRLRQEQLERLGWRFHRIWSQDWFTDRKREIDKAVAAYQAAVVASDDPLDPRRTRAFTAAPPAADRAAARSADRGRTCTRGDRSTSSPTAISKRWSAGSSRTRCCAAAKT